LADFFGYLNAVLVECNLFRIFDLIKHVNMITYMLINAVKELHAEIENLKSEIQELRKAK
jgi:hypothetical protein